jgi:C4-dicarboxylate-specific signal transduction histidine kinase
MKIFELRPWRSFSPSIGSARSAPTKNNDDISTIDTTEINQLINRAKQGELDQGDAQLVEKLLNFLITIVSLLQRNHASIRRMKELLFGMKEKKRAKDEAENRVEENRSKAEGSSQTDLPKESASNSTCEGDSFWRITILTPG